MKKSIICILCFIAFNVYPNNNLKYSVILPNRIESDSLKNDYQTKLQSLANKLVELNLLNFEIENTYSGEILLKNKNDAVEFAKKLVKRKILIKKNLHLKLNTLISEDKTKKLWFVFIDTYPGFDTSFYLIIIKSNCKVLYLSNFCCPK